LYKDESALKLKAALYELVSQITEGDDGNERLLLMVKVAFWNDASARP